MGNTESLDTQQSLKITSSDKAMLKEKVVNNRIENINNAQKSVIQDGTITSHEELVKTILFTETAKEQLKKGGSPLTKTDLIAIIIMIDLNKMNNLDYLKTLTVNDLNTIIRSIIYDTNRYVNKSNNLLTNGSSSLSPSTNIKEVKKKETKNLEIKDAEPISNEIALIENKPEKKIKSNGKKNKNHEEYALVIVPK